MPTGICHGFAPTGLPVEQLRPGYGEPLVVQECAAGDVPTLTPDTRPLLVWSPRPENPFSARLYQQGRLFVFDVDGMGSYVIDPAAATIGVPPGVDPYRREARMWGVPAVLCFDHRGDVPLHAAAVEVAGAAVLLVGPSRQGKTTLAAALLAAGHRLLAEDTTCVRLDAVPVVLPGPPTLRLRPDVWEQLEVPHTRVARRDPDRVHLIMDTEARGAGDAVPLAGIIVLHVCADGPVTFEQVVPGTALSNLWVTSFNLPDDAHRAARFAQLGALASTVPVWNLTRPLSFTSLPEVIAAIEKAVSGRS